MARKDIGTGWTRDNRNAINDNFKELYEAPERIEGIADEAVLRSNEAIDTANQAETTADNAKDTAESTKAEMQEIIREQTAGGDIVPEVVQARGTDATLGERLNSVDSELAQKANGDVLPIYASDYGVSHLKTAEENTQLLQQVIIDAESQSRPVQLPYVPDGSFIELNKGIVVEMGGINIVGYGLNTRFKQTVFPNPIFDVIAPNVLIDGFYTTSVDFVADNTNGTRGHMTKSHHAGVLAYSDNIHVKNIKVDNMINGALFFAYDVKNNTTRTNIKGCSIENLEVSNVDFGFSAKYVTDFTFNNIRGSHRQMPGSNTPPHLVYIVGSEPGTNVNVNGSNLMSYDGTGDLAYKFSGIKGGSITNINARNSQGFVWIQDNEDLQLENLTDWDDVWVDRNGSAMATYGIAKNIVISNLFMKMKGPNGKCIRLSKDGNGTTIRNSKFIGNYGTDDMTLSTPVDLQGSNIFVDGIEIEHIGTATLDAGIHLFDAFNATISNPVVKTVTGDGFRYGVLFAKGDGLLLKDYQNLSGNNGKIAVDTSLATGFKVADEKQDSDLLAYDNSLFLNNGESPQITTSGHRWEGGGLSDFGIYSGGVRRQTTSTGIPLIYINSNTSNGEISANVELKGREGMAIRVADDTNYIMFRLDDLAGSAILFKFDNNVATVLKESTMNLQTSRRYDVKVVAYGDVIECFVDGQKVLTHTLASGDMSKFGTATKHGIRPNAAPGGIYRKIQWRDLNMTTA